MKHIFKKKAVKKAICFLKEKLGNKFSKWASGKGYKNHE